MLKPDFKLKLVKSIVMSIFFKKLYGRLHYAFMAKKAVWIKMKSLESDGFMFVFDLHELITVICKLTSIYKPLFLHA